MRIDFALPAPQRLFLVVRGPAPSCRTAGVLPVRGRAGENTVRFAGSMRGRPLRPGVYGLALSPTRRPEADAAWTYVRVVSTRRTVPLADSAREPACTAAAVTAADPTARLLLGELQDAPHAGAPAGREETGSVVLPTAPLRPPPTPRIVGPRDGAPEAAGAGALATDGASGIGELLLTFVVFVLVGGLLLLLLAALTRTLGHKTP